MRVELRRLRAGELDHELIWLAVTVSAALLALRLARAESALAGLHFPLAHGMAVCDLRRDAGFARVFSRPSRRGLAFQSAGLCGTLRDRALRSLRARRFDNESATGAGFVSETRARENWRSRACCSPESGIGFTCCETIEGGYGNRGRPTSSSGAPRCCRINSEGLIQPRVSSR